MLILSRIFLDLIFPMYVSLGGTIKVLGNGPGFGPFTETITAFLTRLIAQ